MRPHLGPCGKPPSPEAHAAATADAFDATQEYCTPSVVLFWQPPSCFSQWTPSRFTIDGTSYLCAEQYFAAEKSHLFGDYHVLQNIMRVSDPKLDKQYGREVRNFDAVVWEHERENIVLVGSDAKFTQNPAMRQHLLGTGDRLLAEASPYDTIWGIGYLSLIHI